MKLKALLSIVILSLITYLASGQIIIGQTGTFNSAPKVTICHIPPGNPANAHTISVSSRAAVAHVYYHHDYYGECRKDTTPPPVDSCFCDYDGDSLNDLVYGFSDTISGIRAHFDAEGESVDLNLLTKGDKFTTVTLWLYSNTLVLFDHQSGNNKTYYVPDGYEGDMIVAVKVTTTFSPNQVYIENLRMSDPELLCDCGGGPPPWPVTLTSFKAEKLDPHTVKLMWSTASEENNDYFSIEKTYEFEDWEEVCRVPGHGTTQEPQNYDCIDDKADEGGNNTVYYRPKQVDFNGAYEYFNTIKIRLQDVASTYKVNNVYPNPSSDRLYIKYNSSENSLFDISIISLDGKTLLNNSYVAKKGDQVVDINLEDDHLKPGFYILQVKSSEDTYRQKIYKQ